MKTLNRCTSVFHPDFAEAGSLPYRMNVDVFVLNEHGLIFVGRKKNKKSAWGVVSGGVDKISLSVEGKLIVRPETPEEVVMRELREEIGTDDVHILGSGRGWKIRTFDDWKESKKYRGKIIFPVVVLLKSKQAINLRSHHVPKGEAPEFTKFGWCTPQQLARHAPQHAYFIDSLVRIRQAFQNAHGEAFHDRHVYDAVKVIPDLLIDKLAPGLPKEFPLVSFDGKCHPSAFSLC